MSAQFVEWKLCKRCGEPGKFYRNRQGGFASTCAECIRKRARELRKAKPDQYKAAYTAWRRANPEKRRASNAAYVKRNPEKARAAVARCQAKNPIPSRKA